MNYFRHYKGGVYRLLTLARVEETPDQLVAVYQNVQSGDVWTRPARDFFGAYTPETEQGVRIVGLEKPRFAPISHDEALGLDQFEKGAANGGI